MKIYENGVFGPNFDSCDITSYDLGDAELQFCLPIDPEYAAPFLESRETLENWKSVSAPIEFAKADWDYRVRDESGDWIVGSISFSMRLFHLDMVDLESYLGAEPYCLLKPDELSRLAIEYFRKIAISDAQPLDSEVNHEEILRQCHVATIQEDLIVSKQGQLPWFTNRMKRVDFGNWWSETVIPISERGAIFARMDLTPLTKEERPFFFSDSEAQEFIEKIRKEFFGCFKVTYSSKVQERIKQLANDQ